MEYNIYRLKGDFSQSRGVQLPIKGQFIEKFVTENNKKISKGRKRIVYVKGSDSIFLEDKVGDLKPMQLWFRFGDLRIEKTDIVGNELLQKHDWYGKRYELWSEEKETQRSLETERAKSKARQLIDDAGEDKMKAIALAVFGPEAIVWSDEKCELRLRQEAEVDPITLKAKMTSGNYQAKLLAGLAFVKGVVKENQNRTAVIWEDSQGVIIKLAKGENGIEELGRFLSKNTEESQEVLQSIGDRVEDLIIETEKVEADKDAEIAELKAKLASYEKEKASTSEGLTEIQEAREAFKEKFKKDVPNNMKNNLVWLKNQLSEE